MLNRNNTFVRGTNVLSEHTIIVNSENVAAGFLLLVNLNLIHNWFVYSGHDDVVSFLLHHFRRVRIDQCNKLGFTALMKAAIQGRTRCAKLLLFAGVYLFEFKWLTLL